MRRAAALPWGRKLGSTVTFARLPRTGCTADARHAHEVCLLTRPRGETQSRQSRPSPGGPAPHPGRSHWLRAVAAQRGAACSARALGPWPIETKGGTGAANGRPPSTQGPPLLSSRLPFPQAGKNRGEGATVGVSGLARVLAEDRPFLAVRWRPWPQWPAFAVTSGPLSGPGGQAAEGADETAAGPA